MTMRTAIGMMSGTSADGVDVALIRSDGAWAVETGPSATFDYSPAQKDAIRASFGRTAAAPEAVAAVTEAHISALQAFVRQERLSAEAVDWVGFHGQTIFHDPDHAVTVQIGDAQALADTTGMSVISDFRSADMRQGGQGAPFAPLFHAALSGDLPRPLAVLNLGGVGNVTWIGVTPDHNGVENTPLLAFDTGPASALIDDFMHQRTGQPMDRDGAAARNGTADRDRVRSWMTHPYFGRKPPKSLDRDAFVADVSDLSVEDGAATLTVFTVESVAAAADWMPEKPLHWIVTGGGRKNATMMDGLRQVLGVSVDAVETVGWNGDALEAQAFAWLALRVADGRPTSVPGTTGVRVPTLGGEINRPV